MCNCGEPVHSIYEDDIGNYVCYDTRRNGCPYYKVKDDVNLCLYHQEKVKHINNKDKDK